MPLVTAGRNNLLDSGVANFDYISIHSGDPTSGANELSGGSYARQSVAWNAAASGAATSTAQITVPMPTTGITALYFGVWTAVSAGTFLGYGGLGSTVRGLGSTDPIAGDLIQSNGHGLTTDDRVFVWAVNGESLPSPLSAATLYYVLASGLTTDAFKLSTSSGGAAVDIAALGELGFAKTIPEVFSVAGGNIVFAAGALALDLTLA